MHDDIHPTPLGLLRCLQVLSEEAAFLGLLRTTKVLNQAIEACRSESAGTPAKSPPETGPALMH